MALLTNASTSYDVKASGTEEDVIDIKEIVYSISPTETPFVNSVGTRNVTNTVFEWITEELSATSTTTDLEGEAISAAAASLTTRNSNVCQIMSRAVAVTGTQSAIKLYGKSSQMAHQMARRTKELKRSVEAALLGRQSKNVGAAGTARATASISAWLDTNTSFDATSGQNPSTVGTKGVDARTDSSAQRALTAALINGVMQDCFTEGGEPSLLMVGPYNKTVVSTLGGRGIAREIVDSNTAGANVTVFASDFGNLSVVTDRFQRERDAFLIDPEYFKVAYLRNFQTHTLGKTNDADTKYLVVELGLEATNEAASGGIFDLTTS
jgi:hypothetical protein